MTAALLAYCRATEVASSPWEGLLGTRRAALLRKELWNSQGGGKPQMGVGRELASPPTAPPTSLPMGRGQQEEGLQPILQGGASPHVVFGCCGWGGRGAWQRQPSGCSGCEIFQALINLI